MTCAKAGTQENTKESVTTESDTAGNPPPAVASTKVATPDVLPSPVWIPLDQIDDHPQNLRLAYDEEAIDAIAAQIAELGYEPQHAIVVRRKPNDRFERVTGHLRSRSARKAGLDKILAIIVQLTDDEAYMRLGTDNVHSPVTSIEWGVWAAAFELANGQKGCGLKKAAKQIGKSYDNLVRFRRGAIVFLEHRDHCPGAMTLVNKAVHLSLLYDLSLERQRYWFERLIAEDISREKLRKLIVAEFSPEGKESETPTTKSRNTATPLVATRADDVALERPAAAALPTSVEATGELSSLAHGRQPSLTELSSSAASDPPIVASVNRGDDDCDYIYPPDNVPGYEWIFVEGSLKGARRVLPSTDVARSTGDAGADGGPESQNLPEFRIFDPKSISSTAGNLESITVGADLVSLLASVASGPLDHMALVLRQTHAEIRAAIRDADFRLCDSARVTAHLSRPHYARRPCLVALGEPSKATAKQRVKVVGLACFDANGRALEGPVAVVTPDGFRTVGYDDLRWDTRLGLLYLLVALNDDAVAAAEPLVLVPRA